MKKKLTRIELEKVKKQELAEDEEYLRNVDGPDGQKYVEDYEKNKLLTKKKEVDDRASELQEAGTITYLVRVAEYGEKLLSLLESTEGWELFCVPTMHNKEISIFGRQYKTKEGVLVIIKSPKGQVFTRGITATRNPLYDLKAIETLVEQAENTIDGSRGQLYEKKADIPGFKERKSGLVIPK